MNSRPCLMAFAAIILACPPHLAAQTPAPVATVPDEKVIVLDPFSVTADPYNGYQATQSSTGTRMAADIKNIPFTVDVVPMEIWDDFAVVAFNQQEALSSIPGVSATEGNGIFNVRGISSGSYSLRDGFLRFGRVDRSNTERVEVIKGPAAAVYGKTLPGGIINFISKVPKSKPEYTLELQGGTLDLYRAAVGATGPLVPGKLLYRFDTSKTHEATLEDGRYNDLWSISGQLAWDLNKKTRATIQYDYGDEYRAARDKLEEAVVKAGNVYQGLAWDFPNYRAALNSAGPDTYSKFKNHDVNATLVSRLSSALTLRLAGHWHSFDLATLATSSNWDPVTNTVWNRRPNFGYQSTNGHAVNLDLLGRFAAAGMEHNLLLTVDYVRDQRELGPTYQLDALKYRTATGYPGTRFIKEFDASGEDPNPYPPLGDFNFLFRDQNSINTIGGILLSDRVTAIKDRLIVSLGGRHDRVRAIGEDLVAKTRSDTKVSATTMQSGVNFNLTPDVTLYSSYSTSFSPQVALDPDGNPFPNEEGKGVDVGVKMSLFDKKLFVTATYFDIVYDNIVKAGTDPDTGLTVFRLTGSTDSKGYEFSVGGRLWDALSVKTGVSYTDAVVSGNLTPTTVVLNGLPPRGVPDWAFGAVLKYDFNRGRLKNSFIGMSTTAQSNFRYSESSVGGRYRTRVPGYIKYDFNAGYRWKSADKRWSHSLTLVLKNAFDRDYAYGLSPQQGNPRQWVLRYSLLFK